MVEEGRCGNVDVEQGSVHARSDGCEESASHMHTETKRTAIGRWELNLSRTKVFVAASLDPMRAGGRGRWDKTACGIVADCQVTLGKDIETCDEICTIVECLTSCPIPQS